MRALFIWEIAMTEATRIDGLEIRFAHQDQTIAELNDVITAQWKRIELLDSQIRQLREEFQNMDTGRNAPEPPPPHY